MLLLWPSAFSGYMVNEAGESGVQEAKPTSYGLHESLAGRHWLMRPIGQRGSDGLLYITVSKGEVAYGCKSLETFKLSN